MTSVRTKEDYAQARATIDVLLDEIAAMKTILWPMCLTIWLIKSRHSRMRTFKSPRQSLMRCCVS